MIDWQQGHGLNQKYRVVVVLCVDASGAVERVLLWPHEKLGEVAYSNGKPKCDDGRYVMLAGVVYAEEERDA